MKTIEIYNQKVKCGKNKYNFIIKEVWFDNVRNRKPKFYEIKKNNETILYTSLHQTYHKYRRQLLND